MSDRLETTLKKFPLWLRLVLFLFAILMICLSGTGLWFFCTALREYRLASSRMIEAEGTVVSVQGHWPSRTLLVRHRAGKGAIERRVSSLLEKKAGSNVKIQLDPAEKAPPRVAEPLPLPETILWWAWLAFELLLPSFILLFGGWLVYRVLTVPLPKRTRGREMRP